MTGELYDTYVAALQHDLADLPDGTTRVGVVRRPTSWFSGSVDENVAALAPPEPLLDEVKAEQEAFEMSGICDEEAHNAAWDAADFAARYRAHLDESEDASRALEELRNRLADGEVLALVCYENTEKKRCHRTILRERIEALPDA